MKLIAIDHNPHEEPHKRLIYVIRHGATELNAEHGGVDRIRGWKDIPLSSKGREEALVLAKELADSGIDVLFYSTLSRAKDTAEQIAKTTGAKLIPDELLKPWNVGDYTGHESKDVHPVLCEYVIKHPDKPMPGGESFNTFKQRVFVGLAEALKMPANLPGFVTHHRVERVLWAWDKAGQPADLSIDHTTMLAFGNKTATAEKITVRLDRLPNAEQSLPQGRHVLIPVHHDPFAGHA